MTESIPPTPEQFRQLNRGLMEKVLDKAASDPVWKERFLEDSEAAIQEAGFPELRSLQRVYETAVRAQESEDEVQGQDMRRSRYRTSPCFRGGSFCPGKGVSSSAASLIPLRYRACLEW